MVAQVYLYRDQNSSYMDNETEIKKEFRLRLTFSDIKWKALCTTSVCICKLKLTLHFIAKTSWYR